MLNYLKRNPELARDKIDKKKNESRLKLINLNYFII